MEEIKYIHDIKNGDLVVTRDKKRYIKIDKYLIGEEGHLCISDYKIKDSSILDKDKCEHFDIIEIWAPADVLEFLSFDLAFRELIWKEQEQKYYIKHKWLEYKGYEYVGLIIGELVLELESEIEDEGRKTQFTLEEIEGIKKMYNTTLEDFEIIPVKEI